jgi:hypothetical protein
MRGYVKFLPLLLPLLIAVGLLVVFLHVMGHSGERLAGSNSVPPEGLVVQIGKTNTVCQQILAPHDAASLRFFVSPLASPTPPLSLRLDKNGRTLATSHIAGGWTGSTISFPFPALSKTYVDARFCVRSEGRSAVRFTGLGTGAQTSTKVDGHPEFAVISAEFFRAGKGDAWSELPQIAQRAGVLKGSIAGGWSFWVAAALVLVAGAGAIALSLRGVRS